MTKFDIIDVQLESFFGSKFSQKIQRLVDEELNQGRWVEGYDLAVCRGVIDYDDAQKLLEIVLSDNEELRIERDVLMDSVEACLPQSRLEPVSWIIEESGAFALTDSMQVARFEGAKMIWGTPRISLDGIEFDSLKSGRLCGRTWMNYDSLRPDTPFVLDFETGELLEGVVVSY